MTRLTCRLQFPAGREGRVSVIAPARLRDILKTRGIEVNTHLIRVVKKNADLKRKAEAEAKAKAQAEAEEKARKAEAEQIHRWMDFWRFSPRWTPDHINKHFRVQQYHLQQAALQRGESIPPEDYLEDCPDFPDFVTLYVELLFQILYGSLSYSQATWKAQIKLVASSFTKPLEKTTGHTMSTKPPVHTEGKPLDIGGRRAAKRSGEGY